MQGGFEKVLLREYSSRRGRPRCRDRPDQGRLEKGIQISENGAREVKGLLQPAQHVVSLALMPPFRATGGGSWLQSVRRKGCAKCRKGLAKGNYKEAGA